MVYLCAINNIAKKFQRFIIITLYGENEEHRGKTDTEIVKVLAINNNTSITICKLQIIEMSAKPVILALMLIKPRPQIAGRLIQYDLNTF